MHYIPYNSRIGFHKNIFGAIREGCTVSLRVILPREMQCSGVRLVWHRDGEVDNKYSLSWECM
ncbi:MAG: hypothetical protein IJ264_08020, partial [Clostridia bacterium]|nr:hypothetical protein [Clostridia bacterium]